MYYSYSENTLADSDQHNIWWNRNLYSEEDGSTLSYENYSYTLNSDLAAEWWSYNKQDYSGANYTRYNERHEKSLVTDAYEDYTYWSESNVINQSTYVGQDLDYYWQETYTNTYVEGAGWDEYDAEYWLSRSNGNQWWDEYNYDAATGNWTETDLADGAGAWTGTKIEYSSGVYNLYLYQEFPGSFIKVSDFDYDGMGPVSD